MGSLLAAIKSVGVAVYRLTDRNKLKHTHTHQSKLKWGAYRNLNLRRASYRSLPLPPPTLIFIGRPVKTPSREEHLQADRKHTSINNGSNTPQSGYILTAGQCFPVKLGNGIEGAEGYILSL